MVGAATVGVIVPVGVLVAVGVTVGVLVIVAVGVCVAVSAGVPVCVGVAVNGTQSSSGPPQEAFCTMIGGRPSGQVRLHSPPLGWLQIRSFWQRQHALSAGVGEAPAVLVAVTVGVAVAVRVAATVGVHVAHALPPHAALSTGVHAAQPAPLSLKQPNTSH